MAASTYGKYGQDKDLRQWRMTSAKEIKPALIKRYVAEAMVL